ncbi:vascular endothelial growth factor A, long form isoform X1 [Colius striatus]|uniref:vascular endothelial growth factor A, long form isoform X1 n=1 Tax=Colius striatus TaxID=57412 RepID=UPI002B1D0074|nr:vascular endothelial growth factor A, long form isoform X1 [Colius striatus]
MNFLLTWIHGGLAALLYLQSAELSKAAPALGDGERKPNEVIKFLEVYERSFCRTIETLVDIFQEYPDEVEYIFKPSCVPLMRCAGCCGDEGLECVPVDVYNVTMEIMRIKPHQSQHIAHMSFLQHSKCDCRPKKDVKNKQENCLPASPSSSWKSAPGCVQPVLLSVRGRGGDGRSAWLCGLKVCESWVCVSSGEDGMWMKPPARTVLHSPSSSNSALPAVCWFCTPWGKTGRDGRDWCAFICAGLKVLLYWCPSPPFRLIFLPSLPPCDSRPVRWRLGAS